MYCLYGMSKQAEIKIEEDLKYLKEPRKSHYKKEEQVIQAFKKLGTMLLKNVQLLMILIPIALQSI